MASEIKILFIIITKTKNMYKEIRLKNIQDLPVKSTIKKWSKYIHPWTLHNRFIMTDKHGTKWTILLVIREMQNKTITRCNTLIKMAKVNVTYLTKC